MGAIIGFVLGYALGTRAGDRGWNELLESWQRISSSEEMKLFLTDGLGTAPDLFRRCAEKMVEYLNQNGRVTGLTRV